MSVIKPNTQVFQTAQDRTAWIFEPGQWKRLLSFTIIHNPAGSYAVLKAHYPQYPTLGRGVEQTEAAQTNMHDYLERQALNTGDAEAFVREFAAAVPANPSMDNLWLIKN